MKSFTSRGIAVVAVAAMLGFTLPAVAFADSPTTTTDPATTTTVKAPNPMKAWRVADKAYWDQVKAINETEKAAVATAKSAFYTAMANATTPAERQAARAALTAAQSAAIAARVASLTALGPPPAAPSGSPYGAWLDQVQTINNVYRAAVLSAQSTFAAALLAATTHDERVTARANLQLAVATAATARASALTALGPPPAPTGGGSGYKAQVKAINKAYQDAVQAAKAAYNSAIGSATTMAERATLKAAEELAIANAAVVRAEALTALGSPSTTTTTAPVTTTTA